MVYPHIQNDNYVCTIVKFCLSILYASTFILLKG